MLTWLPKGHRTRKKALREKLGQRKNYYTLQLNGHNPRHISLSKPPPRAVGSPITETPPSSSPVYQGRLNTKRAPPLPLPLFASPTSDPLPTGFAASSSPPTSGSSTQHPTNYSPSSTPTRTNNLPIAYLEFTAFPVNAAKFTSGKQAETSPPGFKSTGLMPDEAN